MREREEEGACVHCIPEHQIIQFEDGAEDDIAERVMKSSSVHILKSCTGNVTTALKGMCYYFVLPNKVEEVNA